MRQPEADLLRQVEMHLINAEMQMSIALSKLGPRAGGLRYMVGAWGDYRHGVSTMLRLRSFMHEVRRASQRAEKWERQEAEIERQGGAQ